MGTGFTFNNTLQASDFDSFLTGISKIFETIFSMITSLLEAIKMLVDGILDIADKVDKMTSALVTGDFSAIGSGQMPVLQAVGTYRQIVGEFIFHLTYFLVAFGCLLTIYKLVSLIYSRIKDVNASGSTSLIGKIKGLSGFGGL